MTARAALALLLIAGPARAAEDERGTWLGEYVCHQGTTALDLTLTPRGDGRLDALFHFHAAASNPGVPEGCFEMSGALDLASRKLALTAGRWLTRPVGYVAVDLVGSLAPDGATLSGDVIGPECDTFTLRRVAQPPLAEACRARDQISRAD